ncbi:MAG: InlB B-repeat-containing protein, partial [Nitrospiraceae bacterium]
MNNRQGNLKSVLAAVLALGLAAITPAKAQTAIGGDLQVFTDMSLIESLTNAALKQHEPGQRPNGTGSVNAGYVGGEMITKPFTFTGRRLVLNYATSAAGSIRVEIQDVNGTPITGYALANFPERYLDEVEGVMKWGSVVDVGSLAGTTVRLRFVMKDADLYAMRFANPENVQYSVSYNANGANGGPAPATQQKEKGVSLVLAMNGGDPLLYKTGYTFAGWNTAANGSGTSYAECATYTHDAALTLYARWAANPTTYTVTFNKNGATSGLGPAALNKVQSVALTLPSNISLAKTGQAFAGWNTAANGTGTNYTAGASYNVNAAVTLYA